MSVFSNDTDVFDFTSLPIYQQKAFYGALFAMAASDGEVAREEMELIFETLALDHLDESDRREIHGYVIDPPDFDTCISELQEAKEDLRFGLMLNLVEVMIADDILEESEKTLLENAQRKLGVNDEQAEALKEFAYEAKRLRERGIDDQHAVDTLKRAAAGLSATGIPIGAVAVSGSVLGLSAAGVTSGLAALGLGIGMVPGIGVAIAIGAGIYYGMNKLFDTGNKRKKEKLQKKRERKAQLAIQNLQETIATLIERLADLQKSAADAEANKEAVRQLSQRLQKLKGLLSKRKRQMETA